MKTMIKSFLAVIFMIFMLNLNAQNPPHPNGGGGPGGGNVPVGGGAPLDGGMLILSCLSMGYALLKKTKKSNLRIL